MDADPRSTTSNDAADHCPRAYDRSMAEVHVLHPGYVRSPHVGSTVGLVVDGDARIVVDPGLVADRRLILDPLAARGIAPADVTHVTISHHHPDHTLNVALFPNAEVIDFDSRYRDDRWLDHDGDGWHPTPATTVWQTPGHTDQDMTLLVETDDGRYAFTHLWWHADRTPEIDPYAPDQAVLERSRARVLAAADVVIPGHGPAFRVR
jgi:glyoxylase-like metal-dependent hydrolase (beta-lactamase superfamily II)